MQRSDFSFDLPENLIAQQPAANRSASKLLVLDGQTGACHDRMFTELPSLLQTGDVLVFNNTQVIPARLHGNKETGGKVEVLIERFVDEAHALAHVRASKSPVVGSKLLFSNNIQLTVDGREGELFKLSLAIPGKNFMQVLDEIGHMPLPPYIQREDSDNDKERYQTVYAKSPGAVAAPTAGLHFDEAMLEKLSRLGIEQVYITLHVGAGTFQPVRVDDLDEHVMHSEWMEFSQANCDVINKAKEEGRRIIAIGTTSVRCLESAAQLSASQDKLEPYTGDTDIFIKPGYKFEVVDAMLTNFHLPESTLLMLVSAFAGYDNVMAAYKHAVKMKYRFFSYGDAMFVTRLTSKQTA